MTSTHIHIAQITTDKNVPTALEPIDACYECGNRICSTLSKLGVPHEVKQAKIEDGLVGTILVYE